VNGSTDDQRSRRQHLVTSGKILLPPALLTRSRSPKSPVAQTGSSTIALRTVTTSKVGQTRSREKIVLARVFPHRASNAEADLQTIDTFREPLLESLELKICRVSLLRGTVSPTTMPEMTVLTTTAVTVVMDTVLPCMNDSADGGRDDGNTTHSEGRCISCNKTIQNESDKNITNFCSGQNDVKIKVLS